MTPKEMKDMREAEKAAEREQQKIDEERSHNLASTDRMDPRLAAERCSCGHKRVIHLDAAWGLAKGHGACAACKCAKFTWVAAK